MGQTQLEPKRNVLVSQRLTESMATSSSVRSAPLVTNAVKANRSPMVVFGSDPAPLQITVAPSEDDITASELAAGGAH